MVVGAEQDSSGPSLLELANQFDRNLAIATTEYRAQHPQLAPTGLGLRAVYPSTPVSHSKEEFDRIQAEKKGFDPGVNQNFETRAQAKEYRSRHGIEQMTKEEFDSEVANGDGSFCRKKFGPLSFEGVEGFNPEAFGSAMERGDRAGRIMFGNG